jgi:hypothetical protein
VGFVMRYAAAREWQMHEKDAKFTVQPVWRGEAKQFAESLAPAGA